MRVAHLHLHYAHMPTAVEMVERFSQLQHLCHAQMAAGATPHVFMRFWQDDALYCNGVHYTLCADNTRTEAAKPWTVIVALCKALRQFQPQVLHIHGLHFPAQVLQVRAALGRQVLLVAQHHAEQPARHLRRWLQWLGLRHVHGFMFTANRLANAWQQARLIQPNRPIYEIVEGSSQFEPMPLAEARAATGLYGTPVVLWVARLHPVKMPLLALEGFAQMAKAIPEARLYMIFDDAPNQSPLFAEVRTWLAQRPETNIRVHLLGKKTHAELAAYYSSADLFLGSSQSESCNYALVESLACGVTPVCSNIPAHQRLTGNGLHGLLWRTGDAADCAQALLQAEQQRSPTNRLKRRQWFEAELSWGAIGRQCMTAYADMYRQLG